MLFVCYPKILHKHCLQFLLGIKMVSSFSLDHFDSQEKLKTMLMQNFWVANKEYYGMLWYFLEWSIDWVFLQVS